MIQTSLNATLRTEKGKKSMTRNLRKEGFVPAICYGALKEPAMIYVSAKELKAALSTEAGEHVLISIKTDSKSELNAKTVIVKDLDKHPIKRSYIHADFQVLDMNKPIKISIGIRLIGKPEGVKLGGILDQVRREIEVKCLPSNIPEHFDIDVTHMNLGDSLHVSDLALPESVEILTGKELTIAVLAAPAAEKAAVEGEAEVAAVEVATA